MVLGEPEAVIPEVLGVDHLLEVLLEQVLDAPVVGLGDRRKDPEFHAVLIVSPPCSDQ